MSRLLREMTVVVLAFTLTGCSMGELSMGSLSPSVQNHYEISDSSFDEAFQTAHRLIEESDLEIYNSNKDTGEIEAGINRSTNMVQGDSRSFVTNFAEFKFLLNKMESGNLVFSVESKSSSDGQAYIDKFIEQYSKYIELKEISDKNDFVKVADSEERDVQDGQIISEIRTGSPVLPEKKHEFSKQEIIQIQTILKKLGYDPGAVDGEMNSKTMDAIKEFKDENKVLKKLFFD